jgi:hypothetical protein
MRCRDIAASVSLARIQPNPNPTTRVFNTAMAMLSHPWPSPPSLIVIKTKRASTAPLGSPTMPSHFTIEAIFRRGLINRSSGATTVGPVTTKIAPNKAQICQ